MYDLTDLIFEKYNEGKLSEEKMILLLEAHKGLYEREYEAFDVKDESDLTSIEKEKNKKILDEYNELSSKEDKMNLSRRYYEKGRRGEKLLPAEYKIAKKYVSVLTKNDLKYNVKNSILAFGTAAQATNYGLSTANHIYLKNKHSQFALDDPTGEFMDDVIADSHKSDAIKHGINAAVYGGIAAKATKNLKKKEDERLKVEKNIKRLQDKKKK